MHARASGVHEFGVSLHDVADQHELAESDAADAVLPASPDGANVPGLIYPFHDRTDVYLATEVDVGRLRQEPHRDFSLPLRTSADSERAVA